MAQQTVLQLIQSACYEANIAPPSTLATSDSAVNQFIYLFKQAGRELVALRCWPQLKKSYTLYLQSGRSNYPLPQDFYSALPNTSWDQSNKWQMQGPLGDGNWNYRQYGYVTLENRNAFRVFGPDINVNDNMGQLQINPTPGDAQQDVPITFEYISKTWLLPPVWVSGGTVTASASVNSGGNVYTHSVGTTAGTVPPNMAYGTGQEGGVSWKYYTRAAWQSSTPYGAGEYVTNGGNQYKCVISGISASSGGPTGTASTNVTDGTAQWLYTAVSAWTAETAYGVGTYVSSGANFYRCVNPGVIGSNSRISGKVAPVWTNTTVSDGTITWTFSPGAYDSFSSESDLCLFDDALIISGLKYRILRARGLEYEHIFNEYQILKSVAVGRWNEGMKLSMGGGYMRSGFNPNLPEGNFSF